jgi:hypothetical protein
MFYILILSKPGVVLTSADSSTILLAMEAITNR